MENDLEYLRLKARLEAFEDMRAEIGPWIMEEREASAREALDNVPAPSRRGDRRAAPPPRCAGAADKALSDGERKPVEPRNLS